MSAVLALACDAAVEDVAHLRVGVALAFSHPCPVMSRRARTDAMLRYLAGRDGWLIDGARHLCPAHAAAVQAAS